MRLSELKKIEKLPSFTIDLDNFVENVKTSIDSIKETVDDIANSNEPITWESFDKLSLIEEKYGDLIELAAHLKGVRDEPRLREVWEEIIPIADDFGNWMRFHRRFADRLTELRDSGTLNDEQQYITDEAVKSYERSGLLLDGEPKKRFSQISLRSSELVNNFNKNLLDGTKAWSLNITDESELAGVPESDMEALADMAESRGEKGWTITLDYPLYSPIMEYCQNRELRRICSKAMITKCSELADDTSFDNTSIINELIKLKEESAKILGMKTPAHLSVASKMVESPEQVIEFLRDLIVRTKPQAEKELFELEEFAGKNGLDGKMQPWDRGFYAEKMLQKNFKVDSEKIRQYFILDNVIDGLFGLVSRLYDIEIKDETDLIDDKWDDKVRFYRLYRDGEHFASVYADFFADSKRKRGGAWMNDPVTRWTKPDKITQLPVAYMVMNFPSATKTRPSLLTHNDIETLFHEFGHALHHMMTEVIYKDASGIRGVEWDAVELPSQLMENWCWNEDIVRSMSSHWKTKRKLPKSQFKNMLAAKNFMSGMGLLRQTEMALFDFLLHYDRKPDETILDVLTRTREETKISEPLEYDRFPNGFSHIFGGGYSAGYFSYLWSEVLSSDTFAAFEETGDVFNPSIAEKFRKELLSKGGTNSMSELYRNFRGRDVILEPFLKNRGIST